MHQEIVEARFPDSFTGGISGQPLCAFIPVRNLSFCVHKVNSIVQAIEQFLVKRGKRQYWWNRFRDRRFWHFDIDLKATKIIVQTMLPEETHI